MKDLFNKTNNHLKPHTFDLTVKSEYKQNVDKIAFRILYLYNTISEFILFVRCTYKPGRVSRYCFDLL